MSKRIILLSALALLLITLPISALNEHLSIYQALNIAEQAEISNFTSIVKSVDLWTVKGSNLNNAKPAELVINARTGLIVTARNVTPKAIVIGENTYEFSGTIYPKDEKYYKTDKVINNFVIYRNDSRYFQIKQAIFIMNEEGFVAYFMTKGPGKTK